MSQQCRYTVEYIPGVFLRFDKYICDQLSLCQRSQVKERVSQLQVNGKKAKHSSPIQNGDEISFLLAEEKLMNPYAKPESESMDLEILYEDDYTLVVNKSSGLVVHPAPGNASGTLVNGVLSHFQEEELGQWGEESRPGIVHRLDKETSGVILIAKTREALEYYSHCFRERLVQKEYRAILRGVLPLGGREIDKRLVRHKRDRKRYTVTESPEAGRSALTFYKEVKRWQNRYSLVAFFPKTGRTHQLRVHSQFMGASILGDSLYGRSDGNFPSIRLMLHAYRLTLIPFKESQERTFEAALPPIFDETVEQLNQLFSSK